MKTKTTHMACTLLAAAVATSAGLQAQQNSSTPTRDEQSITVTGCLQPAGSERGAVGTSGSTTSTASGAARTGSNTGDNQSFMLVNARVGSAPGGGSAVTSVAPAGSGTTESAVRAGSTAPSPAITGSTDRNGNTVGSGAMYALRGDNPELPRHAGQEVEISGRLIASNSPSTTGSSPSTGSTASNATGTSGSAATAGTPQLEVKTIRMIASVCAAR